MLGLYWVTGFEKMGKRLKSPFEKSRREVPPVRSAQARPRERPWCGRPRSLRVRPRAADCRIEECDFAKPHLPVSHLINIHKHSPMGGKRVACRRVRGEPAALRQRAAGRQPPRTTCCSRSSCSGARRSESSSYTFSTGYRPTCSGASADAVMAWLECSAARRLRPHATNC